MKATWCTTGRSAGYHVHVSLLVIQIRRKLCLWSSVLSFMLLLPTEVLANVANAVVLWCYNSLCRGRRGKFPDVIRAHVVYNIFQCMKTSICHFKGIFHLQKFLGLTVYLCQPVPAMVGLSLKPSNCRHSRSAILPIQKGLYWVILIACDWYKTVQEIVV